MDLDDWIGWSYVNEIEWRNLDQFQARRDVEHFVERARRGECATWPHSEPEWVGGPDPDPPAWICAKCRSGNFQPDGWLAICRRCGHKQGGRTSGPVLGADEPPPWSQPPYWTAPTVRLVACHPLVSARNASSTRRSPVTVTRNEWAKDSRIPPTDPTADGISENGEAL